MRWINRGIALVLFAVLAACSSPSDAPQDMPEMPDWQSISGTITYRERIMLSPAAIVNVRLEDVSLADAPSVLIAEQNIENAGQVPISFELMYNPKIIDPRSTYVVRATIYEGNEMSFVTDTAYPALTRGRGQYVDLTLVRHSGSAADVADQFLDINWQLISMNNETIVLDEAGQVPNIRFDSATNTVSGFAGCNNFSGDYIDADGELAIGEMAMTMMACGDAMELESNFAAALRASERFKVDEGQLRTYTPEGDVLLIFRAQN
jgi:putative lipoprotein